MVPTIGRRVYFFCLPAVLASLDLCCLDKDQPFDAGVIFVHDEDTVNLTVTDHKGFQHVFQDVKLTYDNFHDLDYWCEWMPYQKEQAAKAEVQLPVSDATA